MSASLIRMSEVMKRTGFSKAWIYRLLQNNQFPKSVKIGDRSVAFIESEVDEYIENKILTSRNKKLPEDNKQVMLNNILPQKLISPCLLVKSHIEKCESGCTLTELSNSVHRYAKLNRVEKNQIIDFLIRKGEIVRDSAMLFSRGKLPLNSDGRSGEDISKKDNTMNVEVAATPEALRKHAEQLLRAAEEAERNRNSKDAFTKQLAPVKLEILQAAGQMQRKLDEFIDCMDEMNKAIQKLKELSS